LSCGRGVVVRTGLVARPLADTRASAAALDHAVSIRGSPRSASRSFAAHAGEAHKLKVERQKFTPTLLTQTFERRSCIIGAVQGGVGMLLAARMGYIAVAENEKYEMEAESNRVNLTLIPPRRGWILDRNGSPLASNRADFRVDIIPDRLEDP